MINKKKLSALLLTGSMLMSMSIPAFADVPTIGDSTNNNNAKASITKNLEIPEGATIPNATFNFTVRKDTADAPNALINPISYNSSDSKGDLANGRYTISKDSVISFGTFPHAGVYEYTVTETQGNEHIDNGTVTYSKESYKLRVYVENKDDNSVYIKAITAEKDGQKQPKVLFTNTFSKKNSVIIYKKTEGNFSDQPEEFNFTINFLKSDTGEDFTDDYIAETGKQDTTTAENDGFHFSLAGGENIQFENLPVGTRYVVTETGASGYTPEVTVVENGQELPARKGTEGSDLSSAAENSSNLLGENTNTVTFVNRYKDIAITGMIINNLPFVMLISIAGLAFISLAVIKRKRALKL